MILRDWRYTDDKLQVRARVLEILLSKFGSELDKNGEPLYTMKSITECAHDWVSQGNMRADGVVKYYLAYYS
jgi:hypothetical protein